MPMILAPSGEKLSKRFAAVSVTEYKQQGYLPDGLLNYLVRLGWSHGDQEIFSRDELIEKFDFAQVGRTGAKWDQKKLAFVQAEHLRKLPPEGLAALALPFVQARGLELTGVDATLTAACALVAPRATTLVEVADMVDYFFRDPPVLDDKAATKLLTAEAAPRLLALRDLVASLEPFAGSTLETQVKAYAEQHAIALKDFAQPARVALTGRAASPGLFEVMEVLGKQRCLARLEAGAARCASH
jgi:glutamyl-tRNA synthetase